MKTVLSLVLVFLFAGIASAQPPRMEWKGKVKELGDPERLEKPAGPRENDRQRMERERGPWAMPGEFRQHAPGWGPGRNKYGGPKQDGMKNWGGTPFRDFGPGHPWGRMGGGPGGPPKDFRGDFVPGRNGYRGGRGFGHGPQVPPFQGKFKWDNQNSNEKVCPRCGRKID